MKDLSDQITNLSADHQPLSCAEILSAIRHCTDILLKSSSSPCELRETTRELYSLCTSINGLSDQSGQSEDNTPAMLDCGKAIAPADAAKCILELMRTAIYMRGVFEAINEAKKRFPGQRIHILYAGCGPCAPFALGMATRFSPDEICFTLLDISKRSLEAVDILIAAAGLKAYIKGLIQTDASNYKHPEGDPIHILLLEIMNRALTKEPQVAVTANLARQIAEGGILIPESITISASVSDPRKEFFFLDKDFPPDVEIPIPADYRLRIDPHEIFELSLKKLPKVKKTSAIKPGAIVRPTVIKLIRMPENPGYVLLLCTKVKVFGRHCLHDYDSSITMPFEIKNLLSEGSQAYVEFSYWTGKNPGFKYQVVSKWKYRRRSLKEKIRQKLFPG